MNGKTLADSPVASGPLLVKRSGNVKKWLVGGLAAMIVAVLFDFSGRRAEKYVSPPFDDTGVHFSVELPAGWEVSHFKSFPPPGFGRAEVVIGEQDSGWAPQWLRKWLPMMHRYHPFMLIQIYRYKPVLRPNVIPPAGRDGSLGWNEDFPIRHAEREIAANGTLAHQIFFVGRSYYTADGEYQISIQYHREDQDQLIPTLNSIGKTIRLSK